MDISSLLTSVSPDLLRIAQPFLARHPRAYLVECRGLRSGIVRFHEWRVIDPDENWSLLGVGKDEIEAVDNAIQGDKLQT